MIPPKWLVRIRNLRVIMQWGVKRLGQRLLSHFLPIHLICSLACIFALIFDIFTKCMYYSCIPNFHRIFLLRKNRWLQEFHFIFSIPFHFILSMGRGNIHFFKSRIYPPKLSCCCCWPFSRQFPPLSRWFRSRSPPHWAPSHIADCDPSWTPPLLFPPIPFHR